MALPTSAYIEVRGRQTPHGIVVAIYPSTVSGLYCEIQTATANSTLSSKWNSHILAPTSVGEWQYPLNVPPSTKPIYVRARYPAQPGYSAGPYTPVVNARPSKFAAVLRKFPVLMTGAGNVEIPSGSDVFVSSAQNVKVGTQVSTGFVTKTLRFGAGQFVAESTLQHIGRGVGTLVMVSGSSAAIAQCYYQMPKGITITKYTVRGRRATTNQSLAVTLYRISTGGVASAVSTLTFSTAGATKTVNSSALSETVGDANYFIARTSMRCALPVVNTINLIYSELEYKMPTYAKQY